MIDTLIVRQYKDADKAALHYLFDARGFAYDLPDLKGSDILAALVLEEETKVRAAALLRLEVNAFLLLDGDWATPRDRWEALQIIHEAMRERAEHAGIKEANCWLPPEIEKQFAPRIEELGWRRNLWSNYSRKVKNG